MKESQVSGVQIDQVMECLLKISNHKSSTALALSSYVFTSFLHAFSGGSRTDAIQEMHSLFDQAWEAIKKDGNSLDFTEDKPT